MQLGAKMDSAGCADESAPKPPVGVLNGGNCTTTNDALPTAATSPVFVNDAVNALMDSDVVDNMVPSDTSRVLILYTGGTIGMRNTSQQGYLPVRGFLSKTLASMLRFHERHENGSASAGTHHHHNHQHHHQHAEEPTSLVNIPLLYENPRVTASAASSSTEPVTTDKRACHDEQLARIRKQYPDACLFNNTVIRRVRLPALITPPSLYGKRIKYSIIEYDPLLDSSNMTMSDWVKIATDIEVNYRLFDAFLVLHGTDTMAYTASALSFMLEDLGKTVIITGSQVPLAEIRNDAVENLLGALTIAGHFVIPEVGLFFDNKLFRGNRASKVNALDFNAFDSPNLRPLVNVGINIDVSWVDVWRPKRIVRFRTHKELNSSVATLRLFPGITESTVRAFLSPPIAGVVLETFGSGNAPSNRPELLLALKEACGRGVVIVNCSQCKRGLVTDLYQTGKTLLEIGIVPGADMTPECALTKLTYLLGKYSDVAVCRALMRKNLRGELTMPSRRQRFTYLPHPAHLKSHASPNGGVVASIMSIIGSGRNPAGTPLTATSARSTIPSATVGDSNGILLSPLISTSAADLIAEESGCEDGDMYSDGRLERALVPMLLCHAACVGDVTGLQAVLHEYDHMVDAPDYDGRSPLHVAASDGQLPCVEFLLLNGANVHLRDRYGNSPLFDAVRAGHKDIARLLRQAGAHFGVEEEDQVAAALCRAANTGDITRFRMFVECGANLNMTVQDGRTPLHLATAGGFIDIVQLVVDTAVDVRRAQRGQTPVFAKSGLDGARSFSPQRSRTPTRPNTPTGIPSFKRQRRADESNLLSGSIFTNTPIATTTQDTINSRRNSPVQTMTRTVSNSALPFVVDINIEPVDDWGNTPLSDAKRLGHTQIVKILEQGIATLNT